MCSKNRTDITCSRPSFLSPLLATAQTVLVSNADGEDSTCGRSCGSGSVDVSNVELGLRKSNQAVVAAKEGVTEGTGAAAEARAATGAATGAVVAVVKAAVAETAEGAGEETAAVETAVEAVAVESEEGAGAGADKRKDAESNACEASLFAILSEENLEEQTNLATPSLLIPTAANNSATKVGSNSSKRPTNLARKKFFNDQKKSAEYCFQPGLTYTFEFYQHIIDVYTYQLEVGVGSSLVAESKSDRSSGSIARKSSGWRDKLTKRFDLCHYLDGQPLQVMAKISDGGDSSPSGYLWNFELWHDRLLSKSKSKSKS